MRVLGYLGSPYRGFPGGLREAARIVRANHALLLKAGLDVFCPISHSHDTPVDREDDSLWMRVDKTIAARSDYLIVLMMQGWDTSEGLTEERGWFDEWGKPIVFMTPGEVPKTIVSVFA